MAYAVGILVIGGALVAYRDTGNGEYRGIPFTDTGMQCTAKEIQYPYPSFLYPFFTSSGLIFIRALINLPMAKFGKPCKKEIGDNVCGYVFGPR